MNHFAFLFIHLIFIYFSLTTFSFNTKVATNVMDNMVYVEGGEFLMGTSNGLNNEKPEHNITVSSFYMSKYELSKAEFTIFVNETSYLTDAEKEGWAWVFDGSTWNKVKAASWRTNVMGTDTQPDDHPVVQISWNDANVYCQWLSKKTGFKYRLPTEAEWEYAAKGGRSYNGNNYAGGNEANTVAWYWTNSNNTTHPCGQKEPNELGLYDMSGNVWEWCQDTYDADYYSKSDIKDPLNTANGKEKVRRGGAWSYSINVLRTVFRANEAPNRRYNDLGFRLVREK